MKRLMTMPRAGEDAMLERAEFIDNLATTTWYDVRKQMFGDIFQITPLWDMLQSKGRIKERMPNGRYFEIPITYAKADQNQKWFGRGDTFGEADKELWTRLQYSRKNFGDSIVRFWDDEMKNKGSAQILNYVKELLDNHMMTMGDTLGQAVWDYNHADNAINSLPELFSTTPSTGSIGGLDRTVNSYVRNQATDFATVYGTRATDLIPAMTTMYHQCSLKKGKGRRTPDMIITTQSIYEEYEDQVRTMGQYEFSRNTGSSRADLGLGNLSFKGAEIFWDPDCVADDGTEAMYFLNSDTLEFAYDPSAWMEMTAWKAKHNSLDRYAQVVTVCQLLANNFEKNGVLYNIDSPGA